MFPQNSVPRDGNREPALLGVSSSDLKTVVPVAVDPATNRLLVSSTGGGGGSSNVTQWNGNTVDTNSGSKSAGTLRIVIATDQPQLTNSLKVDGSAVTQPISGTIT